MNDTILQQEYQHVLQQIQEIQQELEVLPEGELRIHANGLKHTKWWIYRGDDGPRQYLPKSNRNLAEQLAYRKYRMAALKDLDAQRQFLETYLNNKNHFSTAKLFLQDDSLYKPLLASNFKQDVTQTCEWMNADYKHNTNHPEHLTYGTFGEYKVRSKTESMIDTALRMHHIPFRYECQLILGDKVYYPDFTVLHPVNNTIKYWEHLGMMDNAGYSQFCLGKLQSFLKNGLVLGDNLIITYETEASPMDQDMIEAVIRHHFI